MSSNAKNLKNPCERGFLKDLHESTKIAAETTKKITSLGMSGKKNSSAQGERCTPTYGSFPRRLSSACCATPKSALSQ